MHQDRLTFSIPQAMDALNISRNTIYLEIKAGRLKTFTVGRRRMVSRDAMERYVKDREEETAAA